jgi:hypothetical protein
MSGCRKLEVRLVDQWRSVWWRREEVRQVQAVSYISIPRAS